MKLKVVPNGLFRPSQPKVGHRLFVCLLLLFVIHSFTITEGPVYVHRRETALVVGLAGVAGRSCRSIP